jgi:hypothetical protein
VAGAFSGHATSREPIQLVVQSGNQLVQRFSVAGSPRRKELGYVGGLRTMDASRRRSAPQRHLPAILSKIIRSTITSSDAVHAERQPR